MQDLVEDKLGGDAMLGLHNNLLAVLSTALPRMINDYGSAAEPADGSIDDYGTI